MNDDAIPDLLADKMDYSGKSVVLDEGRSQEVLCMGLEGRRLMADYLVSFNTGVDVYNNGRPVLYLYKRQLD